MGVDGRDDGGKYELKSNGFVDLEQKDFVYFLNGGRPRKPVEPPSGVVPSGQAVEDYSEEEKSQGDADQDEEDEQSVSKVSNSLDGVLAIR